MAKRPTINTLTNTASPTYLTQLNQNFSNIQAQFDNTLSLDGSLPNAMNADLDLNDFDLINAGTVNADNLVVAGTNLNSVVGQAAASATAAATSASASAASAATASQYTPAYFTDVTALLADTRTWPTGQILNTREEGFAYEVVTSGQHVTTAGGVKLIVLPGDVGMNVKAFGAVSDGVDPATGTDNAAAFQAAASTGKTVFIPSGNYRVSTVTFSTAGQRIVGEGMGQTFIHPVNNFSCFIVANDKIEISDLEFRGKTGTGQYNAVGDCIKFDAVTNNASFTRHMEGCKVERVMFRNLKMNGIHVPHLLRESHIRECRFIGMGDAATSRSGIYMRQTLGTPSNNNIIWIDKNIFYRFNTAAIWLRRSTLISPIYSQPSYDGIMITNNLIHGQLQDENGVEPVQPSPTNHVTIEDGTRTMVRGNIFTAIHPQYEGLYSFAAGTACKNVDVSNNQMSVKEIVGGVTYNRATTNATGHFVTVSGAESANITNNGVNGGVYNEDILVSDGDYTTTITVNVKDNLTEAGIILVSSSGLGTWSGEIVSNNTLQIKNPLEVSTTIKAKNGLSAFYGASQPYCLQLQYNEATSGCLIGSPAASKFQVSTAGSTPLLVVDSTAATRPGGDNIYNLGTASFRWATVFAGTGTINTSDRNEKQDIESLNEAELRVAVALKGLVRKFKFRDAVSVKGDAARIHVGVIAQEVQDVFEANGLDVNQYGIFCSDTWVDEDTGEEKTRFGIRYEELFAFIIAAM